ncbi:MAG: acetyl-CoA carboxylase biotin carboxylase subunit family protein [bacterium]
MQPLEKRKILLCLGAGASQAPLIQAGKRMGYRTLGIDRNAAGPGIPYLDEFVHLSTYESEQVVAALRPFREQYSFAGLVARTSGPALRTAAAIAETFDLAGLTHEIVPLATEKSTLRKFCLKNKLPVANGTRVKDYRECERDLTLPVIVKPDLPLVGKKEVRVIFDPSQIEEAIAKARQASGNGYVEIETFIDGFDIGCLFWANQGQAEILALWDERVAVRTDGAINGLGVVVPSVVSKTPVAEQIEHVARRFAAHFPQVNALLILAFRVDMAGHPYVIELHADLGGDLIADELFPAADSRYDYFQCCIQVATGAARHLTRPGFSPTAIIYDHATLRQRLRPHPFVIRREQTPQALHEALQHLYDGTLFSGGAPTNHLAFAREYRGHLQEWVCCR